MPAQRSLLPGRQVSGLIVGLDRLQNSKNGNPRWRFVLGDPVYAPFATAVDSAVSYEVSPGWQGDRVTLVLDGRGQVIDADRTRP